MTFTAVCPYPAQGPAVLPYCLTYNQQSDPDDCDGPIIFTGAPPKRICDDNSTISNVVNIVKSTILDPATASSTWPEFDYVLEVTNDGPYDAINLQVILRTRLLRSNMWIP